MCFVVCWFPFNNNPKNGTELQKHTHFHGLCWAKRAPHCYQGILSEFGSTVLLSVKLQTGKSAS